MTAPDITSDVALAASLVREAGLLARSMRSAGVSAARKTSVSDIVTEADRAAEELIRKRLAAERPDDGVLGEEGTAVSSASGRTWVVDPVDGTYNYAAGLDWWCSAIALRSLEDVLLGAIHQPEHDAVVVGGPSLPATRDGVPLVPLVDRPLATSCVTTYLHPPFFGDFGDEVGEAFARVIAGAATLRMLGSGSRDAVAIATGQLHLSCQHSVPPWDWLPGSAIIRGLGGAAVQVEAGGVVWSLAGAPTAVDEAVRRLHG